MIARHAMLSTAVAALLLAGAALTLQAQHEHAAAKPVNQLVAVLRPTEGNKARGTISFTQVKEGVRVSGMVTGLAPNQKHGFHVHEYGDPRGTDGMAAGGHYNPEGVPHGLPNAKERHAGDFGNIEANAEGQGRVNFVVNNISLVGGKNPIVGRGLVVHRDPDDGSQPTGNAGPRIAVGVIGVANPEFKPAPKKQ